MQTYLPEQVAGAVRVAVGSMEPASMGSKGTLLPDVSTFIAGPGRPGNAALFVLAIDRADGTGIARIINFACPATILGESTLWTADYPGYASWPFSVMLALRVSCAASPLNDSDERRQSR